MGGFGRSYSSALGGAHNLSEVKRSIEGVNTPVEWYETEGLSTYRGCEY